jgi:YHS domain-containing protein
MNFFRFILFCILFYFLYRIIKSLFPSRPPSGSRIVFRNDNAAINEMVQDPQCGIYVAKKDAYANRVGTNMFYFCSEECYRRYLANNTKI